MSLGVLNNLSAMYAENNLNNTNNSLNTVLQQLSSGSKINSGADDAAGLSLVDGLQANSVALAQSQTNAQEGVGLLQVADGALSQVTSLLNRAVTLATEASNGTLNSSQDTAANQEYQSILSEINNIGTTTTYNDTSVFGQASTDIYTGDSSSTGSSIDSLNIRSLSSSNVGDSAGTMSYTNGSSNVFIDLSSDGDNASLNDSLGAAGTTTTVNVGYMTTGSNGSAVSASTTINVGAGTSYQNTAQGLINAINNSGLGLNATFATAAQAGSAAVATALASKAGGGGATDTGIMITGTGIGASGATSNGAGVVGSIAQLGEGQTLSGTLSIVGSDGNTHNIALGTANSTDTLANLASYVDAQGYGVTAAVNATSGALQFTTSNANVSVSSSGLTENTAAATEPAIQMQGATIGTITVANIGDQVSGTLTDTEGINALGTAGTSITLTNQTLAQIKSTINAATATTGIVASTNANAIGQLGQAGYQAIGTVLTLTAANTGNNTAGTSGAAIVDLGTPTVATTGLTTAALAVNTAVTMGTSAGSLGTLSVAQAGDVLSGATIDIMNGASTPVADNQDLSTTGQTLQAIELDINNKGGTNNYGDGIVAVMNSTNTQLTFYEKGQQASLPTISLSANLTDTEGAGNATLAGSASALTVGPDGTSQATLGSLTANSPTDVLNGTLSITPFNSTTASLVPLASQTLQQIATTINGDAAYGINAKLVTNGNGSQTLTFTASSTNPSGESNPIITNSGVITDTAPSVATTMTMADVPTPGVANSSTLGTIAMSGTLTGAIKLGSNTIIIGASNNTGATLAAAINKGNYGVTAAYANGTMTFSSPNSAMSIVTTGGTVLDADGTAVGALVTTNAVTSSAYYSLGISASTPILDSSTSGGTSNVGVTTDNNGKTGTATISYTDGNGTNLSATNLSSQTGAESALTSLNSAITAVAAQDGYIGAQINTLNAVSQVLSTQQQNVVSAQNAVQATDYASATSNMSKYEILSQTGISALAQANSMSQEVTKLLQ